MGRGENPWDDLPVLEEVLGSARHRFSHDLGQNFLMDRGICEDLASAIEPLKEGGIVEVGSGPGGLTRSLLARHDVEIVAVEKDRSCVGMLESLVLWAEGRLRVVEGDVLLQDLESLVSKPRYLQANLPFGVGTVLLRKLLRRANEWEEWVVMLQWEVGERLCAKPCTKSYGRMSVWVQGLCEVECLGRVDSSLFCPPPKVDGMMVRVRPYDEVKENWARVERVWPYVEGLISAGFGMRRKMLNRAWRGVAGMSEGLLGRYGLRGGMRAEEVDVESYWRLGSYLADVAAKK